MKKRARNGFSLKLFFLTFLITVVVFSLVLLAMLDFFSEKPRINSLFSHLGLGKEERFLTGQAINVKTVTSKDSSIIFEDNFDNSPNWSSNQTISKSMPGGTDFGWPVTWEKECKTKYPQYSRCPPQNWTSYRAASSHFTDGPGNDTYILNSGGARGASGKGITYWIETLDGQGGWSGGSLDKWLGKDGYQELYVRYYLRYPPEWKWTRWDNLNTDILQKLIRIGSFPDIDNYTGEGPHRYGFDMGTGNNYPVWIPDWGYRAVTHSTYFFSSFRMAPDYDASDEDNLQSVKNPTDNQWHAYEFYVKMNSAPGVKDGNASFYIDGKLQYNQPKVEWRKGWKPNNGYSTCLPTGSYETYPTGIWNGSYFRVIFDNGVSGSSEPNWPTYPKIGENISDGNLIWTPYVSSNGLVKKNVWQKNFNYSTCAVNGAYCEVYPTVFGEGYFYKVINDNGISGPTEPDWSTATKPGENVSDGGLLWQYAGKNPDGWKPNYNYLRVPDTLNCRVYPTTFGDGYYYTVVSTKGYGFSGLSQPQWDPSGKNFSDGDVIWTRAGKSAYGWNWLLFIDNAIIPAYNFSANREQPLYMDDVVVSTAYIGPTQCPENVDILTLGACYCGAKPVAGDTSNVYTSGFCCSGVKSNNPCTPSVCGNGVVEYGETCDDKNILNGDGCSSSCQVESGWTCSGQPSSCSKVTCVDADHDGYNATGGICGVVDCNDNNASVFTTINCKYNGGSCGNYQLCVLSCPLAPVEICNGMDDNCDGIVDEGCPCTIGQNRSCGLSNVSICHFGVSSCIGGVWGNCTGNIDPSTEICDSIDNDCNGLVDDGLSCVGNNNGYVGGSGSGGTIPTVVNNGVNKNSSVNDTKKVVSVEPNRTIGNENLSTGNEKPLVSEVAGNVGKNIWMIVGGMIVVVILIGGISALLWWRQKRSLSLVADEFKEQFSGA